MFALCRSPWWALLFALLACVAEARNPRGTANPNAVLGPSCIAVGGTITLIAGTPRAAAVAPFGAFFQATATTDTSLSGNTTVSQDVTFTWNYGDAGASGTGTWAYGSNPGANSTNTSTGIAGAHVYSVSDGAGNQNYTVTVTATNGTSTASCKMLVTAYDPTDATNGFPTTNTTCVSASTTPVPGAGGCPASAAVLQQSNFATAISSALGAGKRVLFKCGDTFTGDNATASAVKWSVGAYGGCQNSQSNRPILSDTTNGNQIIGFGGSAGDGRIADLDLEGNGDGARGVWDNIFNVGGSVKIVYQITLVNLYSNGTSESYGWAQGAQWMLANSVQTGETNIGTYPNFNENNPPWTGNFINNLDYQALLGNLLDGTGAPNNGNGIEVLRISACRMCVIANNTLQNANNVGATLKLHNGNTNNSCTGNNTGNCWPCTVGPQFATTTCWTGIYTEFVVESDNAMSGTSGANLAENAPQNANTDERLRNIVFERNLLSSTTGAQGGRLILISAVNETLRDNVAVMPGTSLLYPVFAFQSAQRGLEPPPVAIEMYNNTCYGPSPQSGQNCAGFSNTGSLGTAAASSYAKNTLYYTTASGHAAFIDSGVSNTVSNNTGTATNNPAFTNGSTSFDIMSDFKPTANYTGGTSVPVQYDALVILWPPTWDLGAVHH